MTKSEARAISDGLMKALRVLNGVKLLDCELTSTQLQNVTSKLKEAHDEVERVYNMASSELDRGGKSS